MASAWWMWPIAALLLYIGLWKGVEGSNGYCQQMVNEGKISKQ